MIRNRIYDLFFLTLLLVVFCGIAQLLAPFAGALLASLVCAITFYPLYGALSRWLPHRSPSFVALLADFLVLIVFVTPMILLTWAVVKESADLGPILKQWNVTLDQWRQGDLMNSMPWMHYVRGGLGQTMGMTPLQFQQNVVAYVAQTMDAISIWGSHLAQHALFFVFDLSVMLFTLFFLFQDGHRWYAYFHDLIPLNRIDKEHLMSKIQDTIVGVSRGWLFTSLIQGVTATLGYWVVGIDGAVLLGVLTAVLGLLPVVGTFGMWVPIGIFLCVSGSSWKGAFILAWGAIVVVGLIDTFVRPYLVGRRAELPFLTLFFALLGGVEVWGAKGIIIGPLLVANAPLLLKMYRDRYLRSSEMRPKGVIPI